MHWGGEEGAGGPGGGEGGPRVPPEVLARELGRLYREKLGWRRRLPAVVEAVRRVLGGRAEVYVMGSGPIHDLLNRPPGIHVYEPVGLDTRSHGGHGHNQAVSRGRVEV